MSIDLRIRAIRGVVAPDALGLDPVHFTRPPPPIPLADFFTACQRVKAVRTTDDDAVAWMSRKNQEVAVRWHRGQVFFDDAPRWVVSIAVELSKHLLGSVVDTRGAKFLGPVGTRYPDVLSVLPETDIHGDGQPPDFSETSLRVGWTPLGIRERVLMHVAKPDPALHVVVRHGEPWVTWSGHPSGQQVVGIVQDGAMELPRPDLPTVRWMVSFAARLGSVCCDRHGLVWVSGDGPGGITPLWPQPHPTAETTLHALLQQRSLLALDIEALLDANAVEVQAPVEHDGSWWQRMLSEAA